MWWWEFGRYLFVVAAAFLVMALANRCLGP